MLATCLATAKRCVHSTRSLYSKFKFSELQTEKILSVVNSSTVEDLTNRFGLSKKRANKLHLDLQELNESVTSVDELLSIGGFNENVLSKFCRQILNDGKSTDTGDKISYTTPRIPESVIIQIKSFTAIQSGVCGLAWCTFELNPNGMTKITHWDWRPLPECQFDLHVMASFVSNALKSVPQSDFYVFESPVATNVGTSKKQFVNAQLSNIVAMASILAGQRSTTDVEGVNDTSINNVVYLRKYLYARLFKLYVGAEQISTSKYVETMLRWSQTSAVGTDDVQTMVQVNDDLKSEYISSESHVKEFLSCTLLTGLAFLRLNILKCPQSRAVLAQRSKKKEK